MDREKKHGTLCYLSLGPEIIMIHRNSRPGDIHYMKYVAPGGRLEPGETLQQCARREVREEIGVGVRDLQYRGMAIFNNIHRTFNGKLAGFDYECGIYTARAREPPKRKLTDNGDLIVRVHKENVPHLPQHDCDKFVWLLTQQDRVFSVEFRYRGEDLRAVDVNVI